MKVYGLPYIDITSGCETSIGDHFSMNNGYNNSIIGRQQSCIVIQNFNSKLTIGDNVGMSSTAIVCHQEINIGDNVMFGGNTVVYDTDFHSLFSSHRAQLKEDISSVKRMPVKIGDNVFIGAHSTILKGTIIGDNSIIGAASLVSGTVPPNEIWGGVPAKFIKAIY